MKRLALMLCGRMPWPSTKPYKVLRHKTFKYQSYCSSPDLRGDPVFNRQAAAASLLPPNSTFFMENFTYGNSVILERMYQHLSNVTFTGITVRDNEMGNSLSIPLFSLSVHLCSLSVFSVSTSMFSVSILCQYIYVLCQYSLSVHLCSLSVFSVSTSMFSVSILCQYIYVLCQYSLSVHLCSLSVFSASTSMFSVSILYQYIGQYIYVLCQYSLSVHLCSLSVFSVSTSMFSVSILLSVHPCSLSVHPCSLSVCSVLQGNVSFGAEGIRVPDRVRLQQYRFNSSKQTTSPEGAGQCFYHIMFPHKVVSCKNLT